MVSTGKSDPALAGRPHLAHLDGIRGLASLYVVIFHLMMTHDFTYHLPPPIFYATSWLRYGHFAVDVFIVLSGYCLMLPVLHRADFHVPGGTVAFLIRRAWRILPPYWAALVFTLGMILLSRVLGAPVRADDGTAFNPVNLAAHVLMVHNWFPEYAATINLPMWTVAVEWQIYFIFVLLLLPIWRHFGMVATVLVATLLGQMPRLVLPESFNLDWMCPWFIGLFSLGMAAATLRPKPHENQRQSWQIGAVTGALAATVLAIECIRGREKLMEFLWAKDMLVGLTAASFLVWCANQDAKQTPGSVVSLLQSRPLAGLGAISYSLYLIHLPMMWVVKFVIGRLHLSPISEFAFRLTIAPLMILPVAFAFYLAFERPVLSRRARRRHAIEISTVMPATAGGASS